MLSLQCFKAQEHHFYHLKYHFVLKKARWVAVRLERKIFQKNCEISYFPFSLIHWKTSKVNTQSKFTKFCFSVVLLLTSNLTFIMEKTYFKTLNITFFNQIFSNFEKLMSI